MAGSGTFTQEAGIVSSDNVPMCILLGDQSGTRIENLLSPCLVRLIG